LRASRALTKLDAFTRGAIEVQDEGSQLLALLLDAKRGEMVVDFCAGAGGKTLAIGRLHAQHRAAVRVRRLGPPAGRAEAAAGAQRPVQRAPGAIAHERDERIKRLAGKIDRVLVDAPCSGLGTLRRNPDLKWRQSPQAVQELVAKQTAILDSAARLLKPGGRLVYATCSLLPQENEAIAEAFTAATRISPRWWWARCWRSSRWRARPVCAAAANRAPVTCACGRTGMRPTAFLRQRGRETDAELMRIAHVGVNCTRSTSYPQLIQKWAA
jgi:16S rRNA C967 or C1407 C5-methylase (RsmB/RsmF family)